MSFKFRLWKEESGQAIVMFAIGFVVLLGFTALAVDVGSVASEKSNLQNAADAAALAGAQELPTNPEQAKLVASQYALANGKVGDQVVSTEISGDDLIITVTIEREVDGYFSQVLGINSNDVAAKASAKVTPNVTPVDMITTTTEDSGDPVKSVSGVVPLGVERKSLPFTLGVQYTLKTAGGTGLYSGNFGGLQLGSAKGASDFADNLRDGYDGPLSIGDKIFTETGNMASANIEILNRIASDSTTYDKVDPGSRRVVTVIVLETLDVKGHKEVTIAGFAAFFLEGGIEDKGSGQYEIKGTFIGMVIPNSTGGSGGVDYGAHAPKTTTTTTTTYTTTYTFPQLIN